LWTVLNSDADLILLDEPSNNLDVAGSQHLATAIRARAQRGKNSGAGILLVSHEAELLAAACDRCVDLGVE
jgi:ABC transport system ATP-binding/permease protein